MQEFNFVRGLYVAKSFLQNIPKVVMGKFEPGYLDGTVLCWIKLSKFVFIVDIFIFFLRNRKFQQKFVSKMWATGRKKEAHLFWALSESYWDLLIGF